MTVCHCGVSPRAAFRAAAFRFAAFRAVASTNASAGRAISEVVWVVGLVKWVVDRDRMYYRQSRAASVVPLTRGGLLFKTDTFALRVDGGFADLLQRSILPGLDGTLALSEIARRLNVSADEL